MRHLWFLQSMPPSPGQALLWRLIFTENLKFVKGFGVRSAGISKLDIYDTAVSSYRGLYLMTWFNHWVQHWSNKAVWVFFNSFLFHWISHTFRFQKENAKTSQMTHNSISMYIPIWLNLYFYISVYICRSLIYVMFERSSLIIPFYCNTRASHRIKDP